MYVGRGGAERMVSDETGQKSTCQIVKGYAYQDQRFRFLLVYSGNS